MAAPVPSWADETTTEVLRATSPEIAKSAVRAIRDRLLRATYEPVRNKNAYLQAIVRNKEGQQTKRMLDFDSGTEGVKRVPDGVHDEVMKCKVNEDIEVRPPCREMGAGQTTQVPAPQGPTQQREWVKIALAISKVNTLLNSQRGPSAPRNAYSAMEENIAEMSVQDRLLLHHCMNELTHQWAEISRHDKLCLHQEILCLKTSIQ